MNNFLEDDRQRRPGRDRSNSNPFPKTRRKTAGACKTADFVKPLDVVGYNYMAQRYAVDQARFPGRVIAGTETWGHMMYTFWKETERTAERHRRFRLDGDRLHRRGRGRRGELRRQGPAWAPPTRTTCPASATSISAASSARSPTTATCCGACARAPFIAVLDPQHYGKPLGFTPWAWEPVLDTWTFPGQEGQRTQVDVYSIDEEVELLVNGVSAGRKPAGAAAQNKASFDVVYQPGTIEAVGYTGGKETGRFRLVTASDPAGLRVTADRPVIQAGGG